MTKQPVSFVLSGDEPEKSPNTSLLAAELPPNILTLGQKAITLDHPDFLSGYQEGYSDYEQWHGDERAIDSAVLLFLVRNGWGDICHSVFWQTGYIVGWLHALFAYAYDLGEVQ